MTVCSAALSTDANLRKAAREAGQEAIDKLGDRADFAWVFFSAAYRDSLSEVAAELCELLGTNNLLGCTGESIVGNDREIEAEPAVVVWAAYLPATRIELMHLEFQQTVDGATFVGWPDTFANAFPKHSTLLALADPFTFPADALLERLNEDWPGLPVIGGMASGGFAPGECRMLMGPRELTSGAVVACLSGGVEVVSVVSQGCRLIGQRMVITKAEQNLIFELGGKPALSQLGEMFPQLSPRDQQLVRGGLHVGRATTEYKDAFGRGDFVIRNVLGADPDRGAIAVGDYFRVGQTVQFHVRDEQSADEDLRELLASAAAQHPAPAGGLLFTCNGRGTRLFSEPHHDAAAIRAQFPALPLAGFFAQGEIGPVGAQNFLHGFTASLALFSPSP